MSQSEEAPKEKLSDIEKGIFASFREKYDPENSTLPANYAGGPKGLGDPEDRSLRKLELQYLVTDVVRKKSQKLCAAELKVLADCTSKYQIIEIPACREQTDLYNQCLLKWKNNEEFFEKCKEEYLDKRAEYRRTGVGETDIRHRKNREQRVREAQADLDAVEQRRAAFKAMHKRLNEKVFGKKEEI